MKSGRTHRYFPDLHRALATALFLFIFRGVAFPLFDDLGFAAKGPALGNAMAPLATDINSVYYNPAGLALLERAEITASHGLLFRGLSDGSDIGQSNLAFAHPAGNNRAFGLLWDRLSLSGLYSESTLALAYGRKFNAKALRNFYFGASLKYLSHSFSKTEEAYNAMDGINATNSVDPVLIGENSKSAFDLDIGMIWKISRKYTFGMVVKDILQPDISFSGSGDSVPMKIRTGISHKSLWMLLAAQFNLEKGPGGDMDKSFSLAAERIFPSLSKGDFAARAAVSAGDRDFRRISAGLSYKINKIGIDYAFILPLGTVEGTAGNHRFALSYYFGGPTVEEQYAAEILRQFKELNAENELKNESEITPLDDKRLGNLKELVKTGRFARAKTLVMEKAKELLPDASVLNLAKRISAVASFYPSLPKRKNPSRWEKYLYKGIDEFISGKDFKAVKDINFAQSYNQNDMSLNAFLSKVEEMTHIKADRVPPDFKEGYVEYKIYESDILYNRKKYKEAVKKLAKALEFEPENLAALKKLGSCHYLMENYALALNYWQKALRLETNPRERNTLMKIIRQARKKGGWSSGLEEESGTASFPGRAQKIEKLYKLGADLYLKGEYGKAADIFRKILTIDPKNGRAKKALERILRLR